MIRTRQVTSFEHPMDGLVRSFTVPPSFGISSISLSMTVLFSQHACVMVLSRLSESSRRGGEEV